MLTEFGEDTAGRLRVEEGDVQALCTLAGSLVDETNTLLADLGKAIGHAVLNAEGHMVHTLVALVEPFLDGALG